MYDVVFRLLKFVVSQVVYLILMVFLFAGNIIMIKRVKVIFFSFLSFCYFLLRLFLQNLHGQMVRTLDRVLR